MDKEIKITNGDIFTLEEFKEHCEAGYLIDYDGYGHYAHSKTHRTDKEIIPSDVRAGNVLDYPYVVWYNR